MRSDALVATAFHYLSLVAIESEDDENLGEGPAPIRRSPSPRVEDLPARAFVASKHLSCALYTPITCLRSTSARFVIVFSARIAACST